MLIINGVFELLLKNAFSTAHGESSLLVLHAGVRFLWLSAAADLCGREEEGENFGIHS